MRRKAIPGPPACHMPLPPPVRCNRSRGSSGPYRLPAREPAPECETSVDSRPRSESYAPCTEAPPTGRSGAPCTFTPSPSSPPLVTPRSLDRRSSSPKTRMLEPPQRLAPTTLGRRSQTRFKARICQPSRVAPLTTDALTPPTVRLLPNRAGNASTPMLAIDRARNLSHPLPARKAPAISPDAA